jgi:hypothetical protein
LLLLPGALLCTVLFLISRRRFAWTFAELVALAAPSVIYFALFNFTHPLTVKSLGNLIEFIVVCLSPPIYLAVRSGMFPGPLHPKIQITVVTGGVLLPLALYYGMPSLHE